MCMDEELTAGAPDFQRTAVQAVIRKCLLPRSGIRAAVLRGLAVGPRRQTLNAGHYGTAFNTLPPNSLRDPGSRL